MNTTARRLPLTPEEYRDRPHGVPCLSQSTANTLLSKSPLHAWSEHPLLGNIRRPSTKDTDQGTLLHSLLLGKGQKIEIMEHDGYHSNRAKEDRDNALAAGLLPIKRKDYDGLMNILEQIKVNVAAAGVSLEGDKEVAFEWDEMGVDGPVKCRGMMDIVRPSLGEIVDVKKARSAKPHSLRRSFTDYGYHLQHAAYTSCLEKFVPQLVGRVKFQFIFVELDPPYAVCAPPLSGAMRELGQQQWNRAVRIWERCLATGVWPGYEAQPLEPMPWLMTEMMAQLIEDDPE